MTELLLATLCFVGSIPVSGEPILTIDGVLPRLLLGSVIAWIGVTAMTSGANSVTDWWMIVSTDSVSIAEAIAAGDMAQIRGRVRPLRPDDTLISPLRNKTCVAYAYTISTVVQDAGDSSIDSGSKHRPFLISDGTAEIRVGPDADSLSLDMTTNRLTSNEEIIAQTDDERIALEPAADLSGIGDSTNPIELREGTLAVGETVTVVGKPAPVPDDARTDADAVMTATESHLTVMNDDSDNTALRSVARGVFLLVLGLVLTVFAILVVTPAIPDLI
jgi:hypothetical protein